RHGEMGYGKPAALSSASWTFGCNGAYTASVVRLFQKGVLGMWKRRSSAGFPTVVKRKNGRKVVVWRWYEPGSDGKSHERWKTLGLASQFKSNVAAGQAGGRLRLGRALET